MDPVSQMLERTGGRRPFVVRCQWSQRWCVEIADRAALTLVSVQRGELVVRGTGTSVRAGAGDTVLVQRQDCYRLGDGASSTPTARIEPGQRCRALVPDGPMTRRCGGVLLWGDADLAAADTVFVVAVYEQTHQVAGGLFDTLPDLAHVGPDGTAGATHLLAQEIEGADGGRPGHPVALDRLADLVLLQALRSWCADPTHAVPRWWVGLDDAVVGPALRAIHAEPGDPWTVQRLAAVAGVSRATFARRFSEVMQEAPMHYVRDVRMKRALDLLREPRTTVAEVARRCGYVNPFAFSNAFVAHTGRRPTDARDG